MLRKILMLAVTLVFAVSCSSAKKKSAEEGSSVDTSTDTSIVNKDLSFDATGSDSGKIDGLVTIHFEYDKSVLSAEAKKGLADNARWIKAHGDTKVQIEGHCDERGSIEYNLALGERRAKAVKAYLLSLGADSKRLSVISYGKEKPLDRGDSEAAMAKNRRANFVPLPK